MPMAPLSPAPATPPHPSPVPSDPQFSYDSSPCLYLFTSLTAGSSHITTAASRLQTILRANRIPYYAIDLATDDRARRLWTRRSKGKKIPGLVKAGAVVADVEQVEEWNEFGEIGMMLGAPKKAAPAKEKEKENMQPAGTAMAAAAGTNTQPPAAPAMPTSSDLPIRTKEASSDDPASGTTRSPTSVETPAQPAKPAGQSSLANEVAAAALKRKQDKAAAILRPKAGVDASKVKPLDAGGEAKEETASSPRVETPDATPTSAVEKTSVDSQSTSGKANEETAANPATEAQNATSTSTKDESPDDVESAPSEAKDTTSVVSDPSAEPSTATEDTKQQLETEPKESTPQGTSAVDAEVAVEKGAMPDPEPVNDPLDAAPALSSGLAAVTSNPEVLDKLDTDKKSVKAEHPTLKDGAAVEEEDKPSTLATGASEQSVLKPEEAVSNQEDEDVVAEEGMTGETTLQKSVTEEKGVEDIEAENAALEAKAVESEPVSATTPQTVAAPPEVTESTSQKDATPTISSTEDARSSTAQEPRDPSKPLEDAKSSDRGSALTESVPASGSQIEEDEVKQQASSQPTPQSPTTAQSSSTALEPTAPSASPSDELNAESAPTSLPTSLLTVSNPEASSPSPSTPPPTSHPSTSNPQDPTSKETPSSPTLSPTQSQAKAQTPTPTSNSQPTSAPTSPPSKPVNALAKQVSIPAADEKQDDGERNAREDENESSAPAKGVAASDQPVSVSASSASAAKSVEGDTLRDAEIEKAASLQLKQDVADIPAEAEAGAGTAADAGSPAKAEPKAKEEVDGDKAGNTKEAEEVAGRSVGD